MSLKTFEDLGLMFGFFLIILLAVGQMFLKKKDSKNYIVIAMCLSIGIYQFSLSFFWFDLPGRWFSVYPYIYITGMFSAYCGLAITYLLLTSLIQRDFLLSKKTLFHFIIPAIALAVLIFFGDFPQSQGIEKDYYRQFLYSNVLVIRLVHNFSIILFFIYFAMILRMYTRQFKKGSGKGLQNVKLILKFSTLIVLLSSLYVFSHLVEVRFVSTVYRLRFTIMAVFLFISTYKNPFILNIKKLESYQGYYQKSYIDNINADEIISSFKKLMKTKGLISEERLSIGSVSNKLGISRHQLSEILNHHLNKTFTQYLGEQRLDMAKKLLVEEENKKIIEIANECGYGSISHFNISFKKAFGMSPRQYRKSAAVKN